MKNLTKEELEEIAKNVRNAQYSKYEREVIQKLLDHIEISKPIPFKPYLTPKK